MLKVMLCCPLIELYNTKPKTIGNKANVDITLRPRCALPSPPSPLIRCIACAQNFPDSICICLAYWMIPSAAWHYRWSNDPYCTERGCDGCRKDCQCFWMAQATPKIALSFGDLHPYLIHGSLGSPESSSKTACRSVQPFLHSSP